VIFHVCFAHKPAIRMPSVIHVHRMGIELAQSYVAVKTLASRVRRLKSPHRTTFAQYAGESGQLHLQLIH